MTTNVWWYDNPTSEWCCLIVEVNGVKRYRRIWNPGGPDETLEWGWTLPDRAIPLAPTTVTFCNWCPEPNSPDPQAHPRGQPAHLPPPQEAA